MIHPTALIGEPPEARGVDQRASLQAYPPIVCDDASIGAFVTIDAGTEKHTRVGCRTFLMKHVHIGHDAWIGDDCELAPGVVICGFAIIGERVKIGVNACVLPYVTIGCGAVIGAGAVVTSEVPPHQCYVGNPARLIGPKRGRLKCGCWPDRVNPSCHHHGAFSSQFTSS